MARKQEKRQKRQLKGLPEAARRGQTAPLALFALCVSFLLSNAVTNAQTNCVAAGKYSAAGASVCTNCEAGKYQATAGVESVRVRGREGKVVSVHVCVCVCTHMHIYRCT